MVICQPQTNQKVDGGGVPAGSGDGGSGRVIDGGGGTDDDIFEQPSIPLRIDSRYYSVPCRLCIIV